jgi:hypothetical protein
MKTTAAALVLIALTGLFVLPCVCVADEAVGGHGCCATRTSMTAADTCCPPDVERPASPALSAASALPPVPTALLAADRPSAPLPSSVPRAIACARTPILRV